ncbi:uncharacterized protein BO66DRAFT_167500 [Aspergillus aculeatinus CBS 121060]|uniref:Uncharacterized protein n=1 Tax=Aspergillus aculeatinus CBS 121060 TaxID=1448322 RepID=A0ACD1GZT7_9EURO|nr:hypothetical protein BO66DRAFT_167500 [Aspergillus aculeatinus CBS 121060]RAH66814.1 hypothetical protein BO66DRAFT_167500 [Aspergillus aculeatinus CBS 121060]
MSSIRHIQIRTPIGDALSQPSLLRRQLNCNNCTSPVLCSPCTAAQSNVASHMIHSCHSRHRPATDSSTGRHQQRVVISMARAVAVTRVTMASSCDEPRFPRRPFTKRAFPSVDSRQRRKQKKKKKKGIAMPRRTEPAGIWLGIHEGDIGQSCMPCPTEY